MRTVQDVLCLGVPEGVDPSDAETQAMIAPFLDNLARRTILSQYAERFRTFIQIEGIEWLVTRDPADVEKFQPAHDCATCRAGNDQALAFLREFPGRYVAMANLTYVENWEHAE